MARRIRSRSRRSASFRRPGRSASHRPQSRRRGSTLLIVMVLMGMLALLGVMFYTFAAQERTSAESYSEAAKVDVYGLDVDAQMDFALEQLIVGPNPKYKNSALWGGRHALLPNMLGTDVHPFNGRGVRLVDSGGGVPGIDADNDGIADSGVLKDLYGNTVSTSSSGSSALDLLGFNDSPAAQNGFERPVGQFPAPDVDYTYPDVNNVFLSYDGLEPTTGKRIIIPSFHRPQLLRTLPNQQRLDWYLPGSTDLAGRVMRAHRGHVYVAKAGQQLGSGPLPSRYLNDAEAATAWGATYSGFPFVPPDRNSDGTVNHGVWDNSGGGVNPPPPEFDVDNDGDGVAEGVWIDLDFPPQEAADGTLYVPMVSFTIKDADGLINLNAHGNLARVWNNQVTLSSPFMNTASPTDVFVSKSNLGLSASEINPAWAMNRLPASEGGYAVDTFFGGSPTDWREIANRELLFLKFGRVSTSPSIDLTPGVFGEENLLLNAVSLATGQPNTVGSYGFAYDASVNPLTSPWPGPGQTKIDDNGNLVGVWGGSTRGVAQPAFVHPLDFLGIGTRADLLGSTGPASPKRALLVNSGFGAVWPQYNGYSRSGSGSGNVPVGYFTAAGAGAMTNSNVDALFNDMQEIVFDLAERRDADNLFGPDEMRALHLSTIDYSNAVGGETRLTTLAPYTFAPSTTSYGTRSSQKFREKFTTESWDRKNFSWVYDSLRPWENYHWNNRTNLNTPPTPSDFLRNDIDNDGRPEFPPAFPAATPYTQNDPFRPVLRKLLEMEFGDSVGGRRQLRFSVNHLLTDTNGNPNPQFSSSTLPPSLQLDQRPLTPHPDPASLGATAITNFGVNSYPANGNFAGNVQLQEYWARRDRQLMARDIYVMLYVFGGLPAEVTDLTANDPTRGSIYTLTQCERMAQFSVNLVDALDRDNILTRFEYDPDLSDGWGVDDNPYSGDSLPSGNRPEVWGTERLDVTLSETLAVLTDVELSDFSFTQWKDDGPQATYFTYVELRNPGAFPVDFSNSAWQLEIVPNSGTVTANDPLAKRLTLRDGNIPPGQTFTIGSASTSVGGMYPSIMKVNPDPTTIMTSTPADFDANTTTWIAPPLGRQLDLDLQDGTLASWYQLRNGDGGNPGVNALLESTTPNINENEPLVVNLRRRAYPNRPIPSSPSEEADNPWVSVDTLRIDSVPKVKFSSGDTAAQIQSKLGADKMKSRERREPFAGNLSTNSESAYDAGGSSANSQSYLVNTLEGKNSKVNGNFIHWQHHFDRDFSSLAELLQLPIFGGTDTVRSIGNGFSTPVAQSQAALTMPKSAASQFLVPDPTGSGTAANRWHRVLELMEVPSRAHVSIPGFRNPLDYPRVPGKLNLNTMRHPEVLAALIDDPAIVGLDLTTPSLPAVTDQAGDSRGNYWANLLKSRDGRWSGGTTLQPDSVTTLYLPGTANSTPFRSMSWAEPGNSSAMPQSFALRPWIEAAGIGIGQDPRQFFELGSTQEHTAANSYPVPPPAMPTNSVEPALRDRITGKVLNNTTTRSNVFVAFISIKYFRAVDDNGAIRIGQALATLPGNVPDPDPEHRGFFVIDRSQPERSYDSSTGRFNFKDFILFRQILQ